ncbi:saccharopine dehydrogenase family protein [uncultured Microscilla sp.]|uniref:saccharopine dehydrogenase family protein n=1 Tax=uncultured Microscilla sp. TaxID=432653 RepID=UPI002628DE57|nr:saccharopine dehydrogenase family protein [uncultured Microscilla sp.]
MAHILVIGAGRSADALINYLAKAVQTYQWEMTVADVSADLLPQKLAPYPHIKTLVFDIYNQAQATETIAKVDMVVSLLPASLHAEVAKYCLIHQKHLLTASYLSEEIKAMAKDVEQAGLIFLNEIGLDPGIDHMSAMQMIDEIKAQEGNIVSFKSYTGGLVAPEYDNNPWHYKFTWNPRNVILAGKGGTAQYIENGQYKYIPYHQLFNQTNSLEVEGFGKFETYANRDSLKYRELYGLDNIPTMLRGTLRGDGYCSAWAVLVSLGLTSDDFEVDTKGMTYRTFTEAFLPDTSAKNTVDKLASFIGKSTDNEIIQKIVWTGLLDDIPIPVKGSPAFILQHLLEQKWKLEDNDKDMIVMQHQFEYELTNQTKYTKTSDLVVLGDENHTAMAKTVGLPLAIAAKLILLGKINLKGVFIPTLKEIYAPVMTELLQLGIEFKERQTQLT